MRRRTGAAANSFFSSRCGLQLEDDVVFAYAALGVDPLALIGEALGYYYHLIFRPLRDADREFTPGIGIGIPAELFLGGTANAQADAGKGQSFVGEDGANDQEIVSVAVARMFAAGAGRGAGSLCGRWLSCGWRRRGFLSGQTRGGKRQ